MNDLMLRKGKNDLLKEFNSMSSLLESVMDNFFTPLSIPEHIEKFSWAKGLESSRDKENGKYFLYADFPGVKKEDITIEVKDRVLSIKGLREKKSGKVKSSERRYDLILPDDLISEKCEAKLEDGVLTLEFPLIKEEDSRIKIEVK